MTILFLDIDGVLNTTSSRRATQEEGLDPVCLRNLHILLDERPDLSVVYISTWIKFRTAANLNTMLGIPHHRCCGTIDIKLSKAEGIEAWLKARPAVGPQQYVILDDQGIPAYDRRQVWVFRDIGLTSHDVTAVMELL